MLLILMIPQFAIILPQHKLKHSFVCSLIGQLKYLWRNLHASSFKNPTIRYLHRDHSSWKLFPRIFGNRDLLTRFQIVYSHFFALCGIAFPIGKSPSANFLALFRCARLFALLVHRNEDDTETADAIQKTLLFFCQSSTMADFDNERQYLYMFLSRLFRYLLLISRYSCFWSISKCSFPSHPPFLRLCSCPRVLPDSPSSKVRTSLFQD